MASIQKRVNGNNEITYQVRVRRKGYPTKTASFKRLTDAKHYAQSVEVSMLEGRHLYQDEAKKHTLKETIDRYIEEVLPLKPKSYRDQFRQLKWWKNAIGHYTLAQITSALLVEQRNILKQSKTARGEVRSNATVNRYLSALSHTLNVAIREWLWLNDNPLKNISKLKEPRGRIRFLSNDERNRLLKACKKSDNPYLYTIVILALSTGARKGELLNLKWDDVDFNRNVIVLHETKNKERRVLPICGKALELMKEHTKLRRLDTELLFHSPTIPQQPVDIRKAWETAVKRANLENFVFHSLRHTAASWLLMSGCSTREIADVLGHKTLALVQRYSHMAPSHLTSVVERMNSRFLK